MSGTGDGIGKEWRLHSVIRCTPGEETGLLGSEERWRGDEL